MNILTITSLPILHNGTFGFNSNILETNVINQILLITLLFTLWKSMNVSGTLLDIQNNKILLVTDSEKRFEESVKKFAETKKQLLQSKVIILEIQKETEKIKLELLEIDHISAKNEFDRKFKIALNSLKNHKRLLINEFREELALSALEIATKSFKLLISNELDVKWSKNYLQSSLQRLSTLNQIK